jgi:hypothetical protein
MSQQVSAPMTIEASREQRFTTLPGAPLMSWGSRQRVTSDPPPSGCTSNAHLAVSAPWDLPPLGKLASTYGAGRPTLARKNSATRLPVLRSTG